MITEQDWKEAIAKCQSVKNPNENAYMLLAAATYMLERKEQPVSQIMLEGASYDSGTKFSGVIRDKDTSKVLSVFDELMDTLEVLSPKLYAATIDRLSGIR